MNDLQRTAEFDRLVTIIDEAFGLQSVQPTMDAALSTLERLLFQRRIADGRALDALRAEVASLRGHLETIGMHLVKIDRDGPPDAKERIRLLADQCETALQRPIEVSP
jgi:hypothetical protein